jgi:hypothetical protein
MAVTPIAERSGRSVENMDNRIEVRDFLASRRSSGTAGRRTRSRRPHRSSSVTSPQNLPSSPTRSCSETSAPDPSWPRGIAVLTCGALITNGSTEQRRSHLARAKTNGVTETELTEAIIHLAFYAGWPRAMSAVMVAKEVFGG